MKKLATIALALLLAGCACKRPHGEVTTVSVKVKEPCITEAPQKPAYRFGKGAKPESKAQLAMLLAEDFERAERYGDAWAAAAAGCLVVPPAP